MPSPLPCPQRIALVGDPWSSVKELILAAEDRGIVVHGFQALPKIPEWGQSTFYLAPKRTLLHLGNDWSQFLSDVESLGVTHLLAGADGNALPVIDRLSEELRLRGNPFESAFDRRHKTRTQKALQRAELPFLKGAFVTDAEAAVEFVRTSGGKYPFFLKPEDDGGGNNATPVFDEAKLREVFEFIRTSMNETTLVQNEGAVIQTYADGVEFAIQGTVRDGHTKVSSILRYMKADLGEGRETYQSEWIVRPDSFPARRLIEWVRKANPALGMRNGPFHWEVKIHRIDREIYAIEINPRLIGGSMVSWLSDCVGYSDVDLTLGAYFFPDEFEAAPDVYTLENEGFVFEVINRHRGQVLNPAALDKVASLPGYRRRRLLKYEGNELPVTRHLDTISATFDFAHPSLPIVKAVYRILYQMQRDGSFFIPAPASEIRLLNQ
jgi:hypothetical protein